jgi:hypothetical protein
MSSRHEWRKDAPSINPECALGFLPGGPNVVLGFVARKHEDSVYCKSQLLCNDCNCYRSPFEFGGWVVAGELRFQTCKICRIKNRS